MNNKNNNTTTTYVALKTIIQHTINIFYNNDNVNNSDNNN